MPRTKTMQDFIREHASEIDAAINSVVYRWDGNGGRGTIPTPAPQYDDDEREDWIMNDEGLYNWAKGEGVNVDDDEDEEDDEEES